MIAKFLDKQGWEDRLALERDLSLCEDELFFMMKAIINLEVLFDFLQLANARLKLEHHFRDATKVTEVGVLFHVYHCPGSHALQRATRKGPK
jgi:hypothetical protein